MDGGGRVVIVFLWRLIRRNADVWDDERFAALAWGNRQSENQEDHPSIPSSSVSLSLSVLQLQIVLAHRKFS